MSNQCSNILQFNGDEEYISDFSNYIQSNPDFGKRLFELEKKGNKNEYFKGIPIETAYPNIESVCVSNEEISWDSQNYPSIMVVLSLSKNFPKLVFTLDYEQTGGHYKGNVSIRDGTIENAETVDYDREILDILVEDYDILSMKAGEKLEAIGRGSVDVVCVSVDQEGDFVNKTFKVIFQCDESPVFVIAVDHEGCVDSFRYSDSGGNEYIEDNGYHAEMVSDLQ